MSNESIPSGSSESPSVEQWGQPLFDDVVERFVVPEIERRRDAGTFADDECVYRFQVLFPESGGQEIRLNDEVAGSILAVATRAIDKGEEVTLEDISGVTEYTPPPEDAGVPHVTAFLHRDGWSLAFQFGRGGHPDRFEFLRLAQDFLETARQALAASRFSSFVDAAYSAAELFAKAELLSNRPTVDLVLQSRSHGAVTSNYDAWAKLGNSDLRFAKLLNRLADLRPAARYRQRPFVFDLTRGQELLADLDAMLEHVRIGVVSGVSDAEGNVFYMYATREILAGELVGVGDFTLLAPKVR